MLFLVSGLRLAAMTFTSAVTAPACVSSCTRANLPLLAVSVRGPRELCQLRYYAKLLDTAPTKPVY
jgi:hypothetical protein